MCYFGVRAIFIGKIGDIALSDVEKLRTFAGVNGGTFFAVGSDETITNH